MVSVETTREDKAGGDKCLAAAGSAASYSWPVQLDVESIGKVLLAEGRTSTAFTALGRGITVVAPEPGSLVAYVSVPGGVATAGEPLAPVERLGEVTGRFVRGLRGSQARGRPRVAFFATEGRLLATYPLERWLIGEQPVWNPCMWDESLRGHRSLREQLRRARAKGVTCHRLTVEQADNAAWRKAFDELIQRWHSTRSMPPMGFLVDVNLAAGASWRRTHVAVRDGRLVALLSMVPVPARSGWLLEHLLRDPDAPNGTAELLVDRAMRELSAEGVRWATLGLAPLHGPVNWWLMTARRFSRPFFNFAGLSAFKNKLRPQAWEPIYLAWAPGDNGFLALMDGLRAFAGMPLWRFGVRTAARGPAPLLRMLEWLLLPWTVLLALSSTHPWFPSLHVHVAWVVFDIILWMTLRRLRSLTSLQGSVTRKRTARLTALLALAVSLDAVLTVAQAVTWNLPHNLGPGGWPLLALACLGPALTAPVLWGAWCRLRALGADPPACPPSPGVA